MALRNAGHESNAFYIDLGAIDLSLANRDREFKTAFATCPLPAEFTALLFAGEAERALEAAHDLGYDAIDLSLRDPDDPKVLACAEAAVRSGLAISAVGTGQSFRADGLSLISSDARVIRALEDRMFRLIEFAARFGALVIVGAIRGRLEGTLAERQGQYSKAIEWLHTYSEQASRYDVSLILEPINRYETNFLNTVAEVLTAIADIGTENVGVVADTFHMNIEETSLPDAIRLAGAHLRHLQLSDSNRRAAGQGHIDFHTIATVLREIGYSGYLSAEILPLPDSWTAAGQAITYFRQL